MQNLKQVIKEGAITLYVIILAVFPIAVAILPIVLYVATENTQWMWWMISSLPLGAGLFSVTLETLSNTVDKWW